ncbi:regulator of G-protein signaling 11 isoform X2 [Agrilus planipennis]|uniref:Regulator of G-protein signaling 11 isoform X2 n=1 Tax=Agrilus planipennis TaxID=224129 RepID=A0A7F5R229_AGRPL|nr:regulator of G-protein signaling 11 isoform X2 [Agrilus planipennis]
MEPDREQRCHRPMAFDKMEGLVREMQDPEHGVPVRSQKLFLTSIPSAFMGYDLIEWLMERLGIEESEALNLANQMCQYGYFFPVSDSKNLVVKDDSSLYRFQSAYYWPWQNKPPDNIEYAIYLAKRTLRNKQRHGLEEYELENLGNLRKNLANKWDFITLQAEEQVKRAKSYKKGEKIVTDSQERAYWRVHRPPPGIVSSLEQCPVPTRCRNGTRLRKKTMDDCKREVELLKNSLLRTRIKTSQALENMVQYVETFAEYDPMVTGIQPSNPWVSDDITYWQMNSPWVEAPTEKRIKRWAISIEELISDPTGVQEFTNYLRKEYSHENIRFWMAVNDLRRSAQSQIQRKVNEIFEEFLAPGAPCEINIDGKTMEKVHQEMRNPSRFTFDAAQEHVYTLLLKKDCYPRFVRSEHFKGLLAAGVQPLQKKRFFGFGQTKKKASTSTTPNPSLLQQQQNPQGSGITCGSLSKRRGSDRSLSGSAHELAISGVKDTRVAHSHSQSNLSDIPYRGDLPCQSKSQATPTNATEVNDEATQEDPDISSTNVNPIGGRSMKKPSIAVAGVSTSEDVCPWDVFATSAADQPSRSRKNSTQMESGSSSSDLSTALTDVGDRMRKSCVLTQQFTVDCDRRPPSKVLMAAGTEQRRASVSVPIRFTESSNRPSLSSFEESGPSSAASPLFSDIDNNNKRDGVCASKTLRKSSSLTKTCSVSGISPPIISVSSVIDDVASTANVATPLAETAGRKSDENPASPMTEIPCTSQQQKQQQPLAPLAEPDAESPISEIVEFETVTSKETEAKSNDVCPWEDEETCRTDAPFVKTYVTFGHL